MIEVEGDKDWWDGVKRLAAFNIFGIVEGEEEDEQLYELMHELGDVYWDRKIEECLAKKAKLAAKRKKKAAKALGKQQQDQVGATLMQRWLKKQVFDLHGKMKL